MYAAYTLVYQYIYVYFNCRLMFWVTQRPLLRVHSSSGRCARQRSRLASPRKQHKFWQKIAFICRFNMNSLNTLGNHKQASKVNLSSKKLTTLPSCLPLPPYPSQDPSNNSSSGKILFVFCNLHSLCFESTHAINSITLALSLPNRIPNLDDMSSSSIML